MSLEVMLAVLLAAGLHAAWNAFIRSGRDKLLDTVTVTTGAGFTAALFLPFVTPPAAASWPYLGLSVAVHCVYFYLVAAAYRGGELSFAYPIMRGVAPLITAVLTAAFLAERLGAGGWLGVLLLSTGVLWLARDGRRSPRNQHHALAVALFNAAVIVIYTVVDGLGVRASHNAWGYVVWLFFLTMPPMLVIGMAGRAGTLKSLTPSRWLKGFAGGICTLSAYGLVLWAMTQAPIALVAALRETSVLFGTLMAALVLKERFGRARWAAAAFITAGAIAVKIG